MDAYNSEFINFFKKHNLYDIEMFKYIHNNSILFDYKDEYQRPFIGCYYTLNNKNLLQKFKVCVPIIDSQITILINIHEYIHAIILYKLLGKKYGISQESEVLPMLYELLYFLENPNKELESHLTKLNSRITKDSSQEYKIALAIQNEMLEYYQKENPNFNKLQKKAKTLSKKHERKNT